VVEFTQVFIGGLTLAGIYLLIATGINVVFGQTKIVNFAHGQFVVLGGLFTWWLNSVGHLPFALGVVISVIGVAVLAYLCDVLVLRRVSANPLSAFLITLGILLILTQGSVDIFTTLPHQANSPFQSIYTVDGVRISESTIVVIVLAALTAVGVFVVLRYTRAGRAVRASAEDSYAAEHVGVRVKRITSATFVLGSALAAWAGCLLAMLYPLTSESGEQYLIEGFSVALVGGLGIVQGGIVAALLLGLTEELTAAYWQPIWVPAISILVIIAILILRPSGIFGPRRMAAVAEGSFLPPIVRMPPKTSLFAPVVFVLALAAPYLGIGPEAMSLLAFAAVYAIMASGVGFLFRLTGRLSFGHGAFWALGAYWAALAFNDWGLGFWPLIAGAAAIGLVGGLVIAVPVMRTRGFSFLIVSFGLADLAYIVATNLTGLTGGTNGLSSLADPGRVFGLNITSQRPLYELVVVVGAVLLVMLWLVERSAFGQRLSTVRENPALAQSLGLNVDVHEIAAFALSGMVVAIAGVLFLYQSSALAPSIFSGAATVPIALMVILGGGRSLLGPALGAFVLTFLPFWLNFGPRGTQYAQGIALILILLVLPQGILPGLVALARRVLSLLHKWPGHEKDGHGKDLPHDVELAVGSAQPAGPAGSQEMSIDRGAPDRTA
jgi:branched-chain amino acid transport system permease protein